MKPPTDEEIRAGYDKITEDGPDARITADLALLTFTNPQLRDTLERQGDNAVAMGLVSPRGKDQADSFLATLCGALIYGLHLGLHIGEARNGRQP